ncbi:MAG: calcium-binding protein, partial [Thiohalorhabdaceae bacterium]
QHLAPAKQYLKDYVADQGIGVSLDDVQVGVDQGYQDKLGHQRNPDDQIAGTSENEAIWGQAGNDGLTGAGGDDVVYGGDGTDALDGGAGDDHLFGGEGNDTLVGRSGTNHLEGGAGHDTYVVKGGDSTIAETAGVGYRPLLLLAGLLSDLGDAGRAPDHQHPDGRGWRR